MMANAQRMIEERKKALNALKGDDKPAVKPSIPPPTIAAPPMKASTPADLDKARKIAQLQVLEIHYFNAEKLLSVAHVNSFGVWFYRLRFNPNCQQECYLVS